MIGRAGRVSVIDKLLTLGNNNESTREVIYAALTLFDRYYAQEGLH